MMKSSLTKNRILPLLMPHLLGCAAYWLCYMLYIRQAFSGFKHYHDGVLCTTEHLFYIAKAPFYVPLAVLIAASLTTSLLLLRTSRKGGDKAPKDTFLLCLGFLPAAFMPVLYSYCFNSRGSWELHDALFGVALVVGTAVYVIFAAKNKIMPGAAKAHNNARVNLQLKAEG